MTKPKAKRKRRHKPRKPRAYVVQIQQAISAVNPVRKRWYQHVWIWGGAVLTIITGIVTVDALPPHLTIQRDFLQDASDPYSESFSVVNDGFLYARKLSVICKMNFASGNFFVMDSGMLSKEFKDELDSKDRVSLPCKNPLNLPRFSYPDGAMSQITVTYFVGPTPWKKTQSFPFTVLQGKDGQYHWTFH